MSVLEDCFARIRGRGMRVVMPEAQDERIVAAAGRLRDEGLADPILLDASLPTARIEAYAELYVRARPETKVALARRLASKPLFHAALMVNAGDAEAMIAGVATTTARVID